MSENSKIFKKKFIFEKLKSIFFLIKYDFSIEFAGTSFGSLWNILKPVLQFAVYWFIFSIAFRRPEIEGIGYFYWFLSGFLPWFFISAVLIVGAQSILRKKYLIKKIKFPIDTIPTSVVLNQFFIHAALLLIFLPLIIFKTHVDFLSILCLLYYMIANLILLIGITLGFSIVTVLLKDFIPFLAIAIQGLFWLSPIIWITTQFPLYVLKWLALNPFFYILIGYKQSLLGLELYPITLTYHLYFWGLVLIIYLISFFLYKRFKPYIDDII